MGALIAFAPWALITVLLVIAALRARKDDQS